MAPTRHKIYLILVLLFLIQISHGYNSSHQRRILLGSPKQSHEEQLSNNYRRRQSGLIPRKETKSSEPEEDVVESTWWKTFCVIILCVGHLITVLGAMLFLSAILLKTSTRNVSYNIYLIALVIPDIIINGGFILVSSCNKDMTNVVPLCTQVAVWLNVFYYAASFWTNFVISYEMFDLVKKSYQRRTVNPPSLKKVYIQLLCIYTCALMMATWCALNVPWSPINMSSNGRVILNSGEGGVFSLIATLFLILSVVFIPTAYALYFALMIWCKRLLPRTGRTRVISLYFFRILLLFFAFYYPYIVIMYFEIKSEEASNARFFLWVLRRALVIIQAFTTMHLSMKKTDVKVAVNGTVTSIHECFCSKATKPKEEAHVKRTSENDDEELDDNKHAKRKNALEDGFSQSSESPSSIEDVDIRPVDMWDAADVYDDPARTRGSFFGEQLQHAVWDFIDNDMVTGDSLGLGRSSTQSKKSKNRRASLPSRRNVDIESNSPLEVRDEITSEEQRYDNQRRKSEMFDREISDRMDVLRKKMSLLGLSSTKQEEKGNKQSNNDNTSGSRSRIVACNGDDDILESSNDSQVSEVSLGSLDSDFHIINEQFKRLDDECDEISEIIQKG